MCMIIGNAVGERLLMTAKLMRAEEALKIGLVHEVVPQHALMESAEVEMKKLLKFPDNGRCETKKSMRSKFSEEWSAFASPEALSAWSYLAHPNTINFLGKVMDNLSKGKSKM